MVDSMCVEFEDEFMLIYEFKIKEECKNRTKNQFQFSFVSFDLFSSSRSFLCAFFTNFLVLRARVFYILFCKSINIIGSILMPLSLRWLAMFINVERHDVSKSHELYFRGFFLSVLHSNKSSTSEENRKQGKFSTFNVVVVDLFLFMFSDNHWVLVEKMWNGEFLREFRILWRRDSITTARNERERNEKSLCVVCQMLDDFQHQDSWSHVVVGWKTFKLHIREIKRRNSSLLSTIAIFHLW